MWHSITNNKSIPMRNQFRHSTTTGPHGLSNKMFGKGLPPTCTPTLRLPTMFPLNSSSRQLRSTPKFPPESMQASVSTLSTCGPLPKFARSLSATRRSPWGKNVQSSNMSQFLMVCSNSRTQQGSDAGPPSPQRRCNGAPPRLAFHGAATVGFKK